ncbi:J domain-containing protein [Roseivirga sp.]|uniref:J domain-containing protein n=1 Tax=Roseivirga sp. TaxID=1964215 RepID=UPI002B264B14|nr:DnaJ domain-containing protein [Roseivirga sp.]
MLKNYYQILGLNFSASEKEIKQAYRAYALKFHPDKQNGDKFFEERFKEIKEAYDVLGNIRTRSSYDIQLKNSNSFSHTSSNSLKEQELREREERISKKEADLNIEVVEKQKTERLKNEQSLSKTIYFKNEYLQVNGLYILVNDESRINLVDYDLVQCFKKPEIKKIRHKVFHFISWSIPSLITVLLLLSGQVLLAILSLLGLHFIFKTIAQLMNKISMKGEYIIKISGTNAIHDLHINGNIFTARKIVKSIKSAMEDFVRNL